MEDVFVIYVRFSKNFWHSKFARFMKKRINNSKKGNLSKLERGKNFFL